MTLNHSSRRSCRSLVEIFPISLDAAVDLLEILEDTSSVVDPVEVVVFRNDLDAIHYRLRWTKARRLIDTVWTSPPGTSANVWVAENVPDSDIQEWARLWFMVPEARSRFVSALMQATATMVGPDPMASPFSA
jgi:hypothetical protein